MSWLISRTMMEEYENSRSLQGLVEEYLAGSCSDGEPSVPLNMNPMPPLFLPSDKMTDFFRLSRFGMTFGLLTDDLGRDALMWFLAGFPVKTSAQPGREPESQENEADSGWKWRESSVKYDRAMRLWKTRQCSLFEDSEWFSETWPRWGLMRDGECWGLPMSERPTFERGYGLLPTPCRYGNGGSGNCKVLKNLGISRHKMNPNHQEWLMMWPQGWTELTPLATDKYLNALP